MEPELPPLRETVSLEGSLGPPSLDSSQIAQEIEDLIFRSCPRCRTSFGGGLEVCPVDGARLSEQSLLARDTLLLDSSGTLDGTIELRKYCPRCRSHFQLHLKACPQCSSPLLVPTLGGSHPNGGPVHTGGELIGEKYRVIHYIGGGGFGSVYLVKHEALGKRYAVKMLKTGLLDRTAFRNRFHEEALKLSRLEDENIVKVIDFGEWQDSQYMVTEYVDGKDLGALIYEESMPPLRAARIVKQVASALAEAHSKKIVHLDLKPPNVLVSERRGRDLVKVIDFGIAELCSETRVRRQERVAGTCSYMAPEQWRREPLDPRTDIYSLGVIFYECLAGRPPFKYCETSRLERAHCEETPPPLRKLRPDVPAEIEKLVHRCLEKSPARRVQSAQELEQILEAFVRRSENRLAAWLRRGVAAAALLGVIALAGSLVWENWLRDKEDPRWLECRTEGLVATPPGSDTYLTRAREVVLILEAADNRGVSHLVVTSLALPESKAVTGAKGQVTIPLRDVGTVQVGVQAFDRSGNPSRLRNLTFKRIGDPTMKALLADLPKFTNQESVELALENLAAADAARVVCRNGDSDLLEVNAQRAEDGSYVLGGPAGPRHPRSSPDGPLKIVIPLSPGRNTVEVWSRDSLSGREEQVPGSPVVVEVLRAELPLEVRVMAGGTGVVARAEGSGWLSAAREVQLHVFVPGASTRLREETDLHYRLNDQEGLQTRRWTRDEVERGEKLIRIALDQGRNSLSLEPLTDRYGNVSERAVVEVEWDPDPPRLTVLEPEVPFYGEEPPSVRFQIVESNPAAGAQAIRLLDGRTGKPLDPAAYRVEPGDGDLHLLRFLDVAAFRADGEHHLRLEVRDLVGNESPQEAGRFTILSDHTAPRLESIEVGPATPLGVHDSLVVRVRVNERFLKGLTVTATISLEAPGVSHRKSFALMLDPEGTLDPGTGLWKTVIPMGPSGVNKPKLFDVLDPGFDLTITARDATGGSDAEIRRHRFRWETGDRLFWKKDRSVLVYHEAVPRQAPAFWLGESELTNGQFWLFLDAQGGKYDLDRREWWSPEAARLLKGFSFPRSPEWDSGSCPEKSRDLPVRGISWLEAEAYCRWAGLRPPRQEEWLAAAFWDYGDGGWRSTPWPEDSAGPDLPVWTGKDKKEPGPASGFERGATPLGLFHMFGNVWEMVLEPKSGLPVRVGGGFDSGESIFLDSQYRGYLRGEPPGGKPFSSAEWKYNQGLRVALSPPEE